MKYNSIIFCFILFFSVFSGVAVADDKQGAAFIKGKLFFPEIILDNQKKLKLTPDQKKRIKNEVIETQNQVNELQWNLKEFSEEFSSEIEAFPVNQNEALGQLQKMLDTENKIKVLHMTLLIRMKNILNKNQLEILSGLN